MDHSKREKMVELRKASQRVGHPSTNWLIETAAQAWSKHNLYEFLEENTNNMDFDYKNGEHVKIIIEAGKVGIF